MRATRVLLWSVGVGALLYLARPRGLVTTSYDLDSDMTPTSYPDTLKQFAAAIARAEGFYVAGSLPERANNPGNLKVPGHAGPSINGISVFDSVDEGWEALYRQLWLIVTGRSSYYHLDMTIEEMGRVWTATVHQQAAWSNNVAESLGVSSSAPLAAVLV